MKLIKKTLLSTVLLFTVVTIWDLSTYEGRQSTTSILQVVDKGHSSDYEQKWIKIRNPQSISDQDKELKIYVEESSVWNLIEVEEKLYTLTYYKRTGGEKWRLNWIGFSDDQSL
jgi:hypothetical protein